MVIVVGLGVTAAGLLMLAYRERVLRALARSPGTPEGSSGYRLLAAFNGLAVPVVMVPLGLVIIAVGVVRLA